jgi:hypothetical protein
VNLNTIYILAYQPKQEVGLVGINAYSGEDLQSPNCMFFVPQGKVVDTFDKRNVPVCVFNFPPLSISFKDVQKCADFH